MRVRRRERHVFIAFAAAAHIRVTLVPVLNGCPARMAIALTAITRNHVIGYWGYVGSPSRLGATIANVRCVLRWPVRMGIRLFGVTCQGYAGRLFCLPSIMPIAALARYMRRWDRLGGSTVHASVAKSRRGNSNARRVGALWLPNWHFRVSGSRLRRRPRE